MSYWFVFLLKPRKLILVISIFVSLCIRCVQVSFGFIFVKEINFCFIRQEPSGDMILYLQLVSVTMEIYPREK